MFSHNEVCLWCLSLVCPGAGIDSRRTLLWRTACSVMDGSVVTNGSVVTTAMCWQMTNVSRASSSLANTDLIYYFVPFYDDRLLQSDENETVRVSAAEDTCRLMMSVDAQRAAIMLGYVIITQCQSPYQLLCLDSEYCINCSHLRSWPKV